jgi:hypothetical protein
MFLPHAILPLFLATAPSGDGSEPAGAIAAPAGAPAAFIENRGQWPERIRMAVRAGPLLAGLEDGAMEVVVRGLDPYGDPGTSTVRLEFEGTRGDGRVVPDGARAGTFHYFLGDDPGRWASSVPGHAGARYTCLYDGVDILLRDNGGVLEYDLLLEPGADPGVIVVRVDGALAMHLDGEGRLVLETLRGPLLQSAPVAWQVHPCGRREALEARFVQVDPQRFGFALPGRDPGLAAVVDPGLLWSSFLGGSSWESAYAAAAGPNGTFVVVGQTGSTNFPTTPGAYDTSYNGVAFSDVFVTCTSADGSSLVWSTFLGGTAGDEGCAVFVDGAGVTTVGGVTQSSNFPVTAGAIKSSLSGSSDAFLSRLSADGSTLVFSTLLGGSSGDLVRGVVVDGGGVSTVLGTTDSSNFPVTPGAWDTTLGGSSDAFVSRINATGTALVYSTYLGGSAGDTGEGIAAADGGTVIVTGSTSSNDFPTTPGAWDTTLDGNSDAFVTKLDATGTGLIFSTYLGGSAGDTPKDVAVNASLQPIVTGTTASANFPTTAGAFDTSHQGSSDAFVTRLSADGSAVLASTFLGGDGGEVPFHIALDASGGPLIGGVMSSSVFPTTPGAFQTASLGSSDAFLARFTPALDALVYSTLIGGSQGDVGEAMDATPDGRAALSGTTSSSNFPITPGVFDPDTVGSSESFVSVFETGGASGPVTYCTPKVNSLGCLPSITFTGLPSAGAGSGFHVRCVDTLNNKLGLLFYGLNGRSSAPFQGGFLCVAAPVSRTGVQSSGGSATGNDCSGVFSIDFNAWIASGADPALVAGQQVNGQYWSRDPQVASGTNLSDGIEFTIQP